MSALYVVDVGFDAFDQPTRRSAIAAAKRWCAGKGKAYQGGRFKRQAPQDAVVSVVTGGRVRRIFRCTAR